MVVSINSPSGEGGEFRSILWLGFRQYVSINSPSGEGGETIKTIRGGWNSHWGWFPLILLQAKAVSPHSGTAPSPMRAILLFPLILLQAKAVSLGDSFMEFLVGALTFPLILLQAKAVSSVTDFAELL